MTNPTILVAIDDLFFLSKITTALKAQGCTARVATQLQAILKDAVDQKPSLVILDLGIGTLDPAQLIQEVRRLPQLIDLPVLCYTNHTQVPSWEEKLKDTAVKVVPNSYISSNICSVVGLISLFISKNID
ncbi:MAG: response regulator [Nitrospirae bacterium]|nr:response regulator [Nitrospirota bacterium]